MSTLQGARLYHDGQLEGRRTRIPVFLGRGPDEPPDGDLRAFYARLLRAVADAGLRDGDWRLCDCEGWPDNDSHRRLVAWCWSHRGLAPPRRRQPLRRPGAGARAPAVGRRRGTHWQLTDRLDGERFERAGDELAAEGLYVALDAWASNFLALVGDD